MKTIKNFFAFILICTFALMTPLSTLAYDNSTSLHLHDHDLVNINYEVYDEDTGRNLTCAIFGHAWVDTTQYNGTIINSPTTPTHCAQYTDYYLIGEKCARCNVWKDAPKTGKIELGGGLHNFVLQSGVVRCSFCGYRP